MKVFYIISHNMFKRTVIDNLADTYLGLKRVNQPDGYFSHYKTLLGGCFGFDPENNIADAEQLAEAIGEPITIKWKKGEGFEASQNGDFVLAPSICEAITMLAVKLL